MFRGPQIIIDYNNYSLLIWYPLIYFFLEKFYAEPSVEYKYHSISNYFLSQNWFVFLFHRTRINFLNPILKHNSFHPMSVCLSVCLVDYNLLKETIIFYSSLIPMASGTKFIYFIKLN